MKIIREKQTNEILYCGNDLVLNSDGLKTASIKASNIKPDNYEMLDVDEADIPSDFIGRSYTFIDGLWTRTALGVQRQQEQFQQLKTNKLSQVQLKKNEMIDAGFLVNDIKFDSDIAARLAYAELGLQLQSNPEFTTMWKASDGVWVTMNSTLYQQVIAAGKTHIESCFAWQAAKEIEINTSSTIEELESIEI